MNNRIQNTTAEHFYTSKYVGKIPLITTDDEENHHAIRILQSLDYFIEENMKDIKKFSGQISALQAYILSFSHLNKENPPSKTAITGKTFFNYLEEIADTNPEEKRTVAPILVLSTDDIVHPASSISSHLDKTSLVIQQTITLSINEKIENILKIIMHETQRLYNSLYFPKNTPCDLSPHAINKFIKFTNTIEFGDKIHQSALEDIHQVLLGLEHDAKKEHTLDELSAHLTALFIYYPQYEIRELINMVLENFGSTTIKMNNQDEALLVAKTISDAFSMIEHAIWHMSIALYQFSTDKTIEKFESLADEQPLFGQVASIAIHELKKLPVKDYEWDACIKSVGDIDAASAFTIEAASYHDSSYSLHQQAKSGNNEMIQFLLDITKKNINQLDKSEFSPLAHAVINGHPATVELLLQYGASLMWHGPIARVKNNTLLHLAAQYSNEMIPSLLRKGLDPTVMNEKKQTPLALLGNLIADTCHHGLITEKAYKASITALTYLLSYSHEQAVFSSKENTETIFYNSLIAFRKNIALLYVLHESGTLSSSGIKFPQELIPIMALQATGYIPNEGYKNCYKDIILELLKNKKLLSMFITQGMNTAYNEIQEIVKNDKTPSNTISQKIGKLIPLNLFTKNEQSKPALAPHEKRNHLLSFYLSRNLLMGSESLSALTMAKRQLQSTSKKSTLSERKLAINEWKKKSSNNEDEGLSIAIMQACHDIGMTEIDGNIYHKLAAILNKLVIQQKKTPATYSPNLFAKELKIEYQEATTHNESNLKQTPN